MPCVRGLLGAGLVAAPAGTQASSVVVGEGGLNYLTCLLQFLPWQHIVEHGHKKRPQMAVRRKGRSLCGSATHPAVILCMNACVRDFGCTAKPRGLLYVKYLASQSWAARTAHSPGAWECGRLSPAPPLTVPGPPCWGHRAGAAVRLTSPARTQEQVPGGNRQSLSGANSPPHMECSGLSLDGQQAVAVKQKTSP